jgi:hypothetical protein
MNVKPKGSVTLPRRTISGMAVLPWAQEVNRALQELRDRIITVPSRPGQGGGGKLGAFFTTYTDEIGDTYIQAGTVTGGNGGSATVADEKILDAETGVGTNSGKVLYIKVACSATIDSGIMLPGCAITTATLETGTTIPDNHTFTVAAATGDLHFEIGRWNDATFLRAGPPGNFLASGCIGNFALTKL